MTWLLTVFVIEASGERTTVPVGFMVNEDICNIAGRGFESVLEASEPGVSIMWKCENMGAAT